MTHIAVLTSGGDAPGMNACIRAVTRAATDLGWSVSGVRFGYRGLTRGDLVLMDSRSVGGILHQGGTVLGTARYPEFDAVPVRNKALEVMAAHEVDALVVIGGNGTQHGSRALARMGGRVVGVASTIDNDVGGCDITIGVDTAQNVCLESLDRLRATAQSLGRVFLVEVMGRNSGFLAMTAALASGAEVVVVPEQPLELAELAERIQSHYRLKGFAIVVVAEGSALRAEPLADALRALPDFEPKVRVTVLGHVQRGGSPTAFDRILASSAGAAAVDELAAGRHGTLVGQHRGAIRALPIAEALELSPPSSTMLARLADALAR
jgi:6-phosphofructokinase 1